MIDLERQLEDYGTFHDQAWGPITTEFIEARDDAVMIINGPMPRTLPVRRRWLVAVAAAAAVLVLVGGVALLFNLTGSETPPATSTQFWSRVPYDEAVFGGEGDQGISSVTVGGPGLVAVGGDGLHQSGHAAVWTSVDGVTWSRVPDDEDVFGGAGEQWMGTVTAGGPGLVAAGWDLVSFGNADAAVWTSPDGVTWSRVPDDEGVFGGLSYQAIWGVTAGGPGLVAVGEDRSRDFNDGDVAVWTSVDGITWSRVPHDEAVFGAGQVTSVTSADTGLLVAVGNEGTDSGDDAAVWTSVDGFTWSRVPHDEAAFGGAGMQSVTVGGPGFVAVGTSDSEDAVVWTSPDGVTWSRVPHDEAVFGGAGMESVTVGGPGLVAVGSDGEAAAVWTSVDGITWSRAPDDGTVFGGEGSDWIYDVTVGGPGLVAVGVQDGDAAVWVSQED